MTRGTIRHLYYVLLLSLIAVSCAKVSSPAGGPKDKLPPVVVKSIPENGTRNFTGNRITITFNEYIVLDKIIEKFMVSPPMAKKPVVEIKGKSIIIDYEEELHDSTTYTFYFQDAVRDLNEGNILDNYQFVFSTGPVIDSLSVTGNIYSAYTLDAPENTTVLIYRNLDFFNVTKQLPDFISKSDQNGYFRINNVRAGKYLLYALKDDDNSKNFNLPDEEFAFLDSPVEITPEKNYSPVKPDTLKLKQAKTTTASDTTVRKGEYKLILFQPEKKQRYLTSSTRSLPYQLIYTLSLPPDSMNFDFSIPGSDTRSYFIEKSREKDTIRVWITDSTLYSQQQISTLVKYPFTDTTGKVFQKEDTVLMRFLVPRSTRARPRPVPLKVTPSITGGTLKPGQNIVFQSLTPLQIPDTSKIRLYVTEGASRKKILFSLKSDPANSCRILMTARYEQGKKYLFVADSAAFGNLYGVKSDSTGIIFSAGKEQNYGKLILNITGFTGNRIIQVLDNNEKILREAIMQKNGKTEFPFLDKGKYRLRVIYDLNGDGKWTTGDYITRRQPEPVSFYPQEIEIYENSEITQDWNIGVMNVKKLKNTAKRSNV
jgi:uncharacterized protein (DUF2141 family)